MKYYSLKNILAKNARYNIIFGERSNGKTYACLEYILKRYIQSGEQGALVRRWREDFTGKRGAQMFGALDDKQLISTLTNGLYNHIYYWSSRWYLSYIDDTGKKEYQDENPFCYGFAISAQEHDKSTSYPRITTIFFDEFITRNGYLPDEFVLFMNTISTIVRERDDIKIFMCGNTLNKFCPYFQEMGLTHIPKMTTGSIDLYNYGKSGLRVAVEYTASALELEKSGKKSDVYFAFNNPKLEMITSGAWEIAIYPHCPIKYAPKDVYFSFFLIFNNHTLKGNIIVKDGCDFLFFHPWTSQIPDITNQFVVTLEYTPYPSHMRNILKPTTNIAKKIASYFRRDKVFYSDNETGDLVRNYVDVCKKALIPMG